MKEFTDVQLQIKKIRAEIAGDLNIGEQIVKPVVDEDDLSLKKLDEYQSQLQELQRERFLLELICLSFFFFFEILI